MSCVHVVRNIHNILFLWLCFRWIDFIYSSRCNHVLSCAKNYFYEFSSAPFQVFVIFSTLLCLSQPQLMAILSKSSFFFIEIISFFSSLLLQSRLFRFNSIFDFSTEFCTADACSWWILRFKMFFICLLDWREEFQTIYFGNSTELSNFSISQAII